MIPKNWIISLIMVSVMVLGTISVFVPEKAGGVIGSTLYVGGSGPGNYTTIQSAINNVSDGDTVYVYSGTYYENVVIDKSINLIGEDRNITIIDGNGTDTVVYVSSDWVSMSGLTIQNGGGGQDEGGIYLSHSSNNIIRGNTITNNYWGVQLSFSSNRNTIMGNTITNNTEYGIYLYSSNNETIMGNTIANNSRDGIYLSYSSNNNTIMGNTITHNAYGICIYYSSNNNTITENTITNNNNGIWLSYSSNNNTITENTITNNAHYGIWLSSSSNYSTITGNTITNSSDGIWLSYSSNYSIITGNTFTNNAWHGISLSSSSNSTIRGNTITNNNNGIYLTGSSNNNTITENTITNITYYGIYLNSSSGNKIYHNNFVNNSIYATIYYPGANAWDNGYPSGGNYWDNYTGADGNGDHIGDTPYYISGEDNQDRYPLMMQYNLIINQPPICTLSAHPTSGPAPLTVTFTMTASDPDGSITSWTLDSNNDGTPEYSGSGIPPTTKQHIYQTTGTYITKLTVTDNQGATDSDTRTITVSSPSQENQPPVANFGYTPASSSIKANTSIEFMDASTDSDGDIVSWVWDFGDGSTAQGHQVTHTYKGEGTYTVTLTVTDDDGETDGSTRVITVKSEAGDGGEGISGFEMALVVIALISLLMVVRKRR